MALPFVISQIVLNRLESDQENNLRLLTSAYLDGLSAAVLPSAVRADVWEAFDALDRARNRYAGLKVRFAIVALPNGKVLAASDPLKFPVQGAIPPAVDRRFPAEDGLIIDTASGRAWLARSLREEGFSVGRILAEIDISELLRVRKQVLLTLVAVNVGLALGFATIGSFALRRMLKPLSVLSGYVERVRAGRADPIPELKRQRISREFDLLFDRFNAMARALNEHEELASRLADQEKYAVLGKLASGMAHEVNNPLGGLFNALDTLRRHGDDAKVREATLNLLERGLTHIRNVVRSTLVTYRRGVADNSLRPVDIDDLRLLIEPEASRKRLQIRLGQRPSWSVTRRRRKREAGGTQSPDQRLRRDAYWRDSRICEREPRIASLRSKSAIKARDCPTILPDISSDIPTRRPALGTASDFGSCAAWSRTKVERYDSLRRAAFRPSSGSHGHSAKISHDRRRAQDPVGVEAIHAA